MDSDALLPKVDVNAVRLQQAVLCPNCDTISDSPHDACLICGSRSLLPLARVLGEGRSTSAPAAQGTAAAQPPRGIADAVLVLTSPVPHRVRRRRQASPR